MTTQNLVSDEHDRRVKPEFVDEQMGLPVVLLESVYEAQSGEVSGIIVPDLPGLEAAMAMARIMDDFKLNGREIRFLRRALGLKANELASFLDVAAETLSRWENEKEPISTNPERVLRMRVFNALRGRAPGVKADLSTILGMKFRTVRLAGDATMAFKRLLAIKDDGSPEHIWFHEGLRTSAQPIQRLRA